MWLTLLQVFSSAGISIRQASKSVLLWSVPGECIKKKGGKYPFARVRDSDNPFLYYTYKPKNMKKF